LTVRSIPYNEAASLTRQAAIVAACYPLTIDNSWQLDCNRIAVFSIFSENFSLWQIFAINTPGLGILLWNPSTFYFKYMNTLLMIFSLDCVILAMFFTVIGEATTREAWTMIAAAIAS